MLRPLVKVVGEQGDPSDSLVHHLIVDLPWPRDFSLRACGGQADVSVVHTSTTRGASTSETQPEGGCAVMPDSPECVSSGTAGQEPAKGDSAKGKKPVPFKEPRGPASVPRRILGS